MAGHPEEMTVDKLGMQGQSSSMSQTFFTLQVIRANIDAQDLEASHQDTLVGDLHPIFGESQK